MRVTNIIREKIDRELSKKLDAQIKELYAEKEIYHSGIKAELETVVKEANAKARAVLEKYPDAYLSRYGDRNVDFVQGTAYVMFDKDKELDRKAQELRDKKQDLAMDLEIRCALEKNADDFFKMLAEASL